MIPDNDQPKGGSLRDIDLAAAEMAEAVGPAAAAAMHNFAAALRNESMTTVIPTLITTLESVMRKEVGGIERRMIDADRATITYRVENTALLNLRFDTFGSELDHVLQQAKDLRDGQAVLQAGFQTVGETVDGLAQQLDGIVASIVEVRAQAAERTREIYARLDAHNDKLSSQEEAFNALRDAVSRLEVQLADLYNQTLADKYPREKRLELAANNETIPELWNVTKSNTAAIKQLQRDVAEISRLLSDLHHRMEETH